MGRRRFRKKTVKRTKFKVFNSHDYESPKQYTDEIIITAIDPGHVNCGIYSMSYNVETKEKRSLYLNNFKFEKDNERVSAIKKFNELEEEHSIFSRSHYILVEEQMTQSIKNTRMGQHIQTYLMTSLENKGVRPLVVEIGNQMKTSYLHAPPGLPSKGKGSIKEWCVDKAREFLSVRKDKIWEKWFIESTKGSKADDKCDCICYCEVWILLLVGKELGEFKPVDRRVKIEIEE